MDRPLAKPVKRAFRIVIIEPAVSAFIQKFPDDDFTIGFRHRFQRAFVQRNGQFIALLLVFMLLLLLRRKKTVQSQALT